MKILANERLKANLTVLATIEAIEKSFRSKFPKSSIDVRVDMSFGLPSIEVKLTLGGGKADYKGGYLANDAMFQTFSIKGALTEDGLDFNGQTINVVGNRTRLKIPSSKPHMVYEQLTVWRNFKVKTPEDLIRRLDTYFTRLRDLVRKHKEEVSEAQGKDISSYI